MQIWLDGTPGEPINAIISANSSPAVLCPKDSCDTPRKSPPPPPPHPGGGLFPSCLALCLADHWLCGYGRSINFGVSCLGNTNGTEQYANWGTDSACARKATMVEATGSYAGTMAIRRSVHARSRLREITLALVPSERHRGVQWRGIPGGLNGGISSFGA